MTKEEALADELVATFAANVRARRLDLNLTQAELAERIGAYAPYITQIEGGQRAPYFRNIAKFAIALRCKPAFLFRPVKKLSKTS